MKKTITTVLLIVLMLYSWTEDLRSFHQSRVNTALDELNAAKTAYAMIDPNTDEGAARLLETEQAAVDEATALAAQLENENAALEIEAGELQRQVDELEADEDNVYYLAIYDQMVKGIEEVQGYIEGN